MPGVGDSCKRDLGLRAIEGTLIIHLLNNNLHRYWDFMPVAFHFIGYTFLDIYLSFFFLFFFIAAYCSPPSNPVNGTVHSLTGTKLGSTLRFSCDQGFRLIGQSSATCTRTAQGIHQWNAPVPLCQGEGSTEATGDEVNLEIAQKKNEILALSSLTAMFS